MRTAAVGMAMGALAACGAGPTTGAPPPRVSVTHFTVPARDTPSTTAAPVVAPARRGTAVRIMPLGDSFTQGDDPTDPLRPQSYRGALEHRLRTAGYAFDFVGSDTTPTNGGTDVDNEGHGGFTIGPDGSSLCAGCPPANLDAHLDGWLEQARPDVVIVLAGVNDLFPGPSRPVRPEDAPAKLAALVGRVAELAPQAQIMVASYPPVPMFRGGAPETTARFSALNEAARAIGTSGGRLHYVPLAEQLANDWTLADTIADGLHPSPAGSAKIAGVVEQVLVPLLERAA